ARVGAGVQAAASAASDGPGRLPAVADSAPERMRSSGSPGGGLEAALSSRYVCAFAGPPGVRFDSESADDAAYWTSLLGPYSFEGEEDPAVAPATYVAGERWERLLAEAPATWLTHHLRAVVAHARGDLRAAVDEYQASLRQRRTAWALRGLGLALIASGE